MIMNPSLAELREAVLHLHKMLMDDERRKFEAETGAQPSVHDWWQLFTSAPEFAWLRPVSKLIVALDEAMDQKPVDEAVVESMFSQARDLLIPKVDGGAFANLYREALQRSPELVMAHADVLAILSRPRR